MPTSIVWQLNKIMMVDAVFSSLNFVNMSVCILYNPAESNYFLPMHYKTSLSQDFRFFFLSKKKKPTTTATKESKPLHWLSGLLAILQYLIRTISRKIYNWFFPSLISFCIAFIGLHFVTLFNSFNLESNASNVDYNVLSIHIFQVYLFA